MHLGMRGRQEHTNLLWGDIELKKTTSGEEYLAYTERETKQRKGQPSDSETPHTPKMFAVKGERQV